MNAKEALEKAKSTSLDSILKYIVSEADNGRVTTKLYGERFWLSEENRKSLEELGYIIGATGYDNEWLVSWENVNA